MIILTFTKGYYFILYNEKNAFCLQGVFYWASKSAISVGGGGGGGGVQNTLGKSLLFWVLIDVVRRGQI